MCMIQTDSKTVAYENENNTATSTRIKPNAYDSFQFSFKSKVTLTIQRGLLYHFHPHIYDVLSHI